MHKFIKSLKQRLKFAGDRVWVLLIIAAVLISMLPIFFAGIPSGNDVHQHFQFAQIYYDSIISGNMFPDWSAFENYGFGGIGIRFYPPLGYYALAIARIITGNWFDATWLTFLFWMALGCTAVYFWAKEFFPVPEASIAAVLYALLPFHLTQIYQFFIYGEFVASAIIPCCFLFLTRVCRRNRSGDIFFFAIAYALLILSHIPSTIIGSLSLSVYAVTMLDWRKCGKPFIRLAIAFLLGILASSFHWIRIVMEMSWLNHASPTFAQGFYSYKTHFFTLRLDLSEHFWTTFGFLLLIGTCLSAVFVLLPAILLIIKANLVSSSLKTFRGAIITGLLAFFMATPLSTIIWENLPVLQQIQFPWRWFSIVSVVGVISAAGLVVPIVQLNKSKRLVVYSVLIFSSCLIFFDYTQIIIPSAPISRSDFEQQLSGLLNEESFDCWWTIWAKRSAFDNKKLVSAGSREVQVKRWDREIREFEISAGEDENARIATFYYPYWKTDINGYEVETQKAGDGTILIPISDEKATIKLYFQSPFYIKAASTVSILAWIILASGLGIIFVIPILVKAKERI